MHSVTNRSLLVLTVSLGNLECVVPSTIWHYFVPHSINPLCMTEFPKAGLLSTLVGSFPPLLQQESVQVGEKEQ